MIKLWCYPPPARPPLPELERRAGLQRQARFGARVLTDRLHLQGQEQDVEGLAPRVDTRYSGRPKDGVPVRVSSASHDDCCLPDIAVEPYTYFYFPRNVRRRQRDPQAPPGRCTHTLMA